jgi:quinol monooxygenase YgiN
MFHENWASQAHLDAHFQTPHLTAALRRLDELTAEPPVIEIWRQIA